MIIAHTRNAASNALCAMRDHRGEGSRRDVQTNRLQPGFAMMRREREPCTNSGTSWSALFIFFCLRSERTNSARHGSGHTGSLLAGEGGMHAPSCLGLCLETMSTGDVIIQRVVDGDTSVGALAAGIVKPGDHVLKIDNVDVQHLRVNEIQDLISRSENGNENEVELMLCRKSCSFQFIVHVPRPKPRQSPRGVDVPFTPQGESASSTTSTSYVAWMGAVWEQGAGKIFLRKLEDGGAASKFLRHPSVRLQVGDVLHEINGQRISPNCSLDAVQKMLNGESHMYTIVVKRAPTGQTITAVLPRPVVADAARKGAISPRIRDSVELFEQLEQRHRPSSLNSPRHGQDGEERAFRGSKVPSVQLHSMHSETVQTSPRTPPPLPKRPSPHQQRRLAQAALDQQREVSVPTEVTPFRLDFVDALVQALSREDDVSSTRVCKFADQRAPRFSTAGAGAGTWVEAPQTPVSSARQREQDDEVKRDVEICYSNVDVALMRDEMPQAFEWLHKATIMSSQIGLAGHEIRVASTHSKIHKYQKLQVHCNAVSASERMFIKFHAHRHTMTLARIKE